MIEIRLPAGLFDKICNHILSADDESERMAIIYLNSSIVKNHTLLTGSQHYLPDDGDYECHDRCSVALRPERFTDVLNDCIRNRLSFIDIHSHPFSKGENVSFSSIDDDYEYKMKETLTSVPTQINKNIFEDEILDNLSKQRDRNKLLKYFALSTDKDIYVLKDDINKTDKENIKKVFKSAGYSRIDYKFYLCTMVINADKNYDLRCYMLWKDKIKSVKVSQVKFPGFPYRIDYVSQKKKRLTDAKKEILNRQILAFGNNGQELLSALNCAVVGVGGLGSVIAENLCRLGVEKMVLVEPDNSDMSNLNRFSGMTVADTRLQTPKIEVTARYLMEINPDIDLSLYCESVYSDNVLNSLKGADIIISCTDNASSRYWLNDFATQYLIPLINAGNVIRVDKDGNVETISAEINIYLPGLEDNSACLLCSETITPTQVNYEQADTDIKKAGIRGGYIEGADITAPSVVHLNGITANIAIAELHNLIFNYKKLSRCIVFNMLYNELEILSPLKNNECNTCSEKYGKVGRGDSLSLPAFR